MKTFHLKLVILFVCLFGLWILIQTLLPTPRQTTQVALKIPNDNRSTILVELDQPMEMINGKSDSVILRVLLNSEGSNQALIARADLKYVTTPSGEVLEVAGEDGSAVFYWTVRSDQLLAGSGRIWLYRQVDGKVDLLGALPVVIKFSALPFSARMFASIGMLLIGALLIPRRRI